MRRTKRTGYALLIVLAFISGLMSLHAIAYQQSASLLRVSKVRVLQQQRDEGSKMAVARALGLLETGFPPTDPFLCGLSLETTAGSLLYRVRIESVQGNRWRVHAEPSSPGEVLLPMPNGFTSLVAPK